MRFRQNMVLYCLLFVPSLSHAGAWGVGSFENDSALDWASEFEDSKSVEVLLSAFNDLSSSGYLDADICSVALASADVVASMKDGKTAHLPESVGKWVNSYKGKYESTFAESAIEAIRACVNLERSELAELWKESSWEEWSAYISGLGTRLK